MQAHRNIISLIGYVLMSPNIEKVKIVAIAPITNDELLFLQIPRSKAYQPRTTIAGCRILNPTHTRDLPCTAALFAFFRCRNSPLLLLSFKMLAKARCAARPQHSARPRPAPRRHVSTLRDNVGKLSHVWSSRVSDVIVDRVRFYRVPEHFTTIWTFV